jgi:hypothetical protein
MDTLIGTNNIKTIHSTQGGRTAHFDVKEYCSNVDYLLARFKDLQSGTQIQDRKIGEFITTLVPIDERDKNVKLLDGQVLSAVDYPEFYEYMYRLKKSDKYSDIFIDEGDWQRYNETSNGCGNFAIDEYNRTIRLPKITSNIQVLDSLSESDTSALIFAYIVVKVPDPYPHIIKQTSDSGINYRLWSNGYCEVYGEQEIEVQNGKASVNVEFPVEFVNDYVVSTVNQLEGTKGIFKFNNRTNKSIQINYDAYLNENGSANVSMVSSEEFNTAKTELRNEFRNELQNNVDIIGTKQDSLEQEILNSQRDIDDIKENALFDTAGDMDLEDVEEDLRD